MNTKQVKMGFFVLKATVRKFESKCCLKMSISISFISQFPETAIESFHWDRVESMESISTILVVNETKKIAIMNETKDGRYRSYRKAMDKNALEGWIKSEKYKKTKRRWKPIDGFNREPLIDTYNGFWLKYEGSKLVLKRCYRLVCDPRAESSNSFEKTLVNDVNIGI